MRKATTLSLKTFQHTCTNRKPLGSYIYIYTHILPLQISFKYPSSTTIITISTTIYYYFKYQINQFHRCHHYHHHHHYHHLFNQNLKYVISSSKAYCGKRNSCRWQLTQHSRTNIITTTAAITTTSSLALSTSTVSDPDQHSATSQPPTHGHPHGPPAPDPDFHQQRLMRLRHTPHDVHSPMFPGNRMLPRQYDR